ncbi:MAG: hypothetical protein AAGD10_05005 [Myxococcota bacterium]
MTGPRIGAAILLLLLAVGAWKAPPAPDTGQLVWDLIRFRGPDPWVDAAFQLMGVWPMLYARILLAGTGRTWLPKLLALAGFFIGAFALMPAIMTRRFGASTKDDPSWVRFFCRSPWVGAIVALSGFGLLSYGFWFGDPRSALTAWREHGFVWIFGLDFCALSLGFLLLLLGERQAAENPAV